MENIIFNKVNTIKDIYNLDHLFNCSDLFISEDLYTKLCTELDVYEDSLVSEKIGLRVLIIKNATWYLEVL